METAAPRMPIGRWLATSNTRISTVERRAAGSPVNVAPNPIPTAIEAIRKIVLSMNRKAEDPVRNCGDGGGGQHCLHCAPHLFISDGADNTVEREAHVLLEGYAYHGEGEVAAQIPCLRQHLVGGDLAEEEICSDVEQ